MQACVLPLLLEIVCGGRRNVNAQRYATVPDTVTPSTPTIGREYSFSYS